MADPAAATPLSDSALVAGEQYFLECRFADDGSRAYLDTFTYAPRAPGSPAPAVATGPRVDAIARQIYHELPLAFPDPHTSPPADAELLVGFPIWLWVDDTVWRTFDVHATLAGVTVSVVAHPKSLRWNMGDGTTISCAGPGTPWDPGQSTRASECSHVYQYVSDRQFGGVYSAQVTVVWSVSWSASTGEGGSLPDVSRSTDFTLDVGERQAVISYGD